MRSAKKAGDAVEGADMSYLGYHSWAFAAVMLVGLVLGVLCS